MSKLNFKSNVLKISIVIAMILILIPAIAAEDAAVDEEPVSASDDVAVSESEPDDSSETLADADLEADDEAELADELGQAAGGEPSLYETESLAYPVPTPSGFLMDLPAADLEINVYPSVQYAKAGDYVLWLVDVINNGPDMAENAFAYINLVEGDILLVDYVENAGYYDPYTGVWNIGDMLPSEKVSLLILGQALSDSYATLFASVVSDTYDPDMSNNFAAAFVNYDGEVAAAAEEVSEELPATGNPIVMALLALITMVGVSFGRKL